MKTSYILFCCVKMLLLFRLINFVFLHREEVAEFYTIIFRKANMINQKSSNIVVGLYA